MLLTQRPVIQPRAELKLAAQDVPDGEVELHPHQEQITVAGVTDTDYRATADAVATGPLTTKET